MRSEGEGMLEPVKKRLPVSAVLLDMQGPPDTSLPDRGSQALNSLVRQQQLLSRIQELLHSPLVILVGYQVLQIAQRSHAEASPVRLAVFGSRITSKLLHLSLFGLLA